LVRFATMEMSLEKAAIEEWMSIIDESESRNR
jgi:hypothetical protein